jgi:asparagine synthase (glutamine-hydrolysing)
MCGIAGVLYFDGGPVERSVLQQMGDSIAHRGPDGEGFFVDEGRPSVGLVNRRLAVIDVEGGQQPMTVCDDRYTIVYNGELFNTAELRRELEAAGHRFATTCDTEVVVRAYAQWGAEMHQRLFGMWAFAIWDSRDRTLLLSRDRLGIKPLVFAEIPGGLAFGSEIKALTASGLVRPELDPTVLPHYLSGFAVPEPHSLIGGVKRLCAGHSLRAGPAGVQDKEYWDCSFPEEEDRGFDAYRDEVAELLDDAVRRTMVSDVPLGVLLSGGIDSRLMGTFAARHTDLLNTFTLGFDDPGYDERSEASGVAQRLGAVHREAVLSATEAAEALPRLIAAYDEPGQSLVQTHFISRLARESVTVALSGMGGDELFAAYPTHVAANVLSRLDQTPAGARVILQQAAAFLPSHRLRRLAYLSGMEPDARVSRELLHQSPDSVRRALLTPQVREIVDLDGPVHYLEHHFARAQSSDPLNRLLYVYLKTYLTDELLRASDAMSMLNSLELRVPLLDHRLVELAMRIPAHHKMRFTRGKRLLREVARRTLELPPGRGKRGFSLPLGHWLRGPLREQVQDVLTGPSMGDRGIFDPLMVNWVLQRVLAGDDRFTPAVMMLYSFEEWARSCLDPVPSIEPHASVGLETPRPELSVVIVNWNTRELVCACIASVGRHLAGVAHEIIVVDNASTDGSADAVAERFPQVRLIKNEHNAGFGKANNQAMRLAQGDWFLLLNSDTELGDDSVAHLFARVRDNPQIGVAQCRLVLPDGRLQHSTYRFPGIRQALLDDLSLHRLLGERESLLAGYWDHSTEKDVDWVAGAFMLLRRQVFELTGGFDERYFMYGEDLDWCLRIHDLGWKIRYYPDAWISHHDHASSDLLWGEERIKVSLATQQQVYARRHGIVAARALALIKALGAAARLAYYTARGSWAGNERYRAFVPYYRTAVRGLLSLLVSR